MVGVWLVLLRLSHSAVWRPLARWSFSTRFQHVHMALPSDCTYNSILLSSGILYIVFFQPFFALCIWSFWKVTNTPPGRPADVSIIAYMIFFCSYSFYKDHPRSRPWWPRRCTAFESSATTAWRWRTIGWWRRWRWPYKCCYSRCGSSQWIQGQLGPCFNVQWCCRQYAKRLSSHYCQAEWCQAVLQEMPNREIRSYAPLQDM